MEMVQGRTSAKPLKKMALSAALGGVTGFAAMFAFMRVTDGAAVDGLGSSAIVASGVAIIYLLMGLFCGLGMLAPGLGARFLNFEDEGELREQRAMLGYSSAGSIALGLSLGFAALSGSSGPIDGGVALAGFAGFLIVAIVLTVVQRKYTDELLRAVSSESVTAAYYLLVVIGGGWALLAHVGRATPPAPLDWLSMFWGFMLLGVFIAAGRRGMLNPR